MYTVKTSRMILEREVKNSILYKCEDTKSPVASNMYVSRKTFPNPDPTGLTVIVTDNKDPEAIARAMEILQAK